MKAEKEEPIYVGLEQPVEIRKALLEASKNLIKILQGSESRKRQREEKRRLVSELRETMKELTSLLGELKSQMPKVKVSSLPKKVKSVALLPQKSTAKQKEVKMPAAKPKPVHLTEAQKLERELQDIEDKLSKLG